MAKSRNQLAHIPVFPRTLIAFFASGNVPNAIGNKAAWRPYQSQEWPEHSQQVMRNRFFEVFR
jgi:hypothetical protein